MKVEQWGMFEVSVAGPSGGNPFTEHHLEGVFTCGAETISADGFYDGNGIYKVRCMPSCVGEYRYQVTADFLREPVTGSFTVEAAGGNNHGPVRVKNRYYFAYADGTPHYSIGTTCYVWELQSDEAIEQTLDMLAKSAFNKLRFCIFPKHYAYNLGEPRSYPYEGTPMDSSVLNTDNFWDYGNRSEGNCWDFTRFRPEYFQHIEKCIARLMEMGIEADLIVMHPYDRWGFSCMDREADDLYLKYIIARFAAYRNVWWALANEYDLMKDKTEEDWEHFGEVFCKKDPYQHLRSIHNCGPFYDHSREWITHCSLQRQDLYKTTELTTEMRNRYGKPVVWDEIAYEGNIQYGWGNISPQELVRRFWEGAVRGGYPGHGETYMDPSDVLWWSHGTVLRGESWKRAAFLMDVLKAVPGNGLREGKLKQGSWDVTVGIPADGKEVEEEHEMYLLYFGFERPSFRDIYVDDRTAFRVEVLDTWNMTCEDRGIHSGKIHVELPGREYIAVRLTKVN